MRMCIVYASIKFQNEIQFIHSSFIIIMVGCTVSQIFRQHFYPPVPSDLERQMSFDAVKGIVSGHKMFQVKLPFADGDFCQC